MGFGSTRDAPNSHHILYLEALAVLAEEHQVPLGCGGSREASRLRVKDQLRAPAADRLRQTHAVRYQVCLHPHERLGRVLAIGEGVDLLVKRRLGSEPIADVGQVTE